MSSIFVPPATLIILINDHCFYATVKVSYPCFYLSQFISPQTNSSSWWQWFIKKRGKKLYMAR